MFNKLEYPRFGEIRLLEALADSPVVLLHGPRQCGKTTLARHVGEERGYAYYTFDDANLLAAAETDPVGFVADLPSKAILDEVQRAPRIFTSLKAMVDRDRTPGRILLTGSANVLLVPALSDSLAGRMEIMRLHPLAQCEIIGRRSRFLERLWKAEFKLAAHKRLGDDLVDYVLRGGYPAALTRPEGRRRREWHRSYVDALVQRDIRDMARVGALETLRKLVQLAANQTSKLLNVSELASPFQVSRPTISDYVTLLERVFLLEILPPWHNNRLNRLIKTPKLHMGDSGLAAALSGIRAEDLKKDRLLLGPLLETFVLQELRRNASWGEEDLTFHHFRDKDGDEVDIVMEKGAHAVAGVEVKASSTVVAADFRGLRKLRAACGKRFHCGVLLYDGEATLRFEERLYAVPLSTLWE